MAFTRSTLYRLGPTNDAAMSVFCYSTDDLETDIDDADYFLSAINELPLGTLIFCNVDNGGTPLTFLARVTTNDGTTITVTTHALAFT